MALALKYKMGEEVVYICLYRIWWF